MKVAQLVRALDCGSRGRGFESRLSPFWGRDVQALRFFNRSSMPKPRREIVAGSGTAIADSLEPSGKAIIWAPMRIAPVFSFSITSANVPPLIPKVIRTHSPGFMPL